jgi:hypothetical protein
MILNAESRVYGSGRSIPTFSEVTEKITNMLEIAGFRKSVDPDVSRIRGRCVTAVLALPV